MGILSELARRHPDAQRSLHPTKSVVAIGKHARELTEGHEGCVYPYDAESPYFKINKYKGKIIGIGVATTNLSCVHCADDFLKDDFPVQPYHDQLFNAKCLDAANNEVIVKTYAHDMNKMGFNIPVFVKKHVRNDICEDKLIEGVHFFRADAQSLFDALVKLARQRKTIYSKKFLRHTSHGGT